VGGPRLPLLSGLRVAHIKQPLRNVLVSFRTELIQVEDYLKGLHVEKLFHPERAEEIDAEIERVKAAADKDVTVAQTDADKVITEAATEADKVVAIVATEAEAEVTQVAS
jgi:hypothetical protein